MKSVGIIGGLGPESTIDYYRRILEAWRNVDPSTSPSILIDSLDVQIALRLVNSDIPALIGYLSASINRLAAAGVDFIAMSANTPHIVFDDLQAHSPVPLLSIVEVCAEEARRRGLLRPGLLGTRFTMEGGFYDRVLRRHGMTIVTPEEKNRIWVHERYVGELLNGDFREETREGFRSLIAGMKNEQGIDGVILGGTELPLLLGAGTIGGLPVLDTTALHGASIVARLNT